MKSSNWSVLAAGVCIATFASTSTAAVQMASGLNVTLNAGETIALPGMSSFGFSTVNFGFRQEMTAGGLRNLSDDPLGIYPEAIPSGGGFAIGGAWGGDRLGENEDVFVSPRFGNPDTDYVLYSTDASSPGLFDLNDRGFFAFSLANFLDGTVAEWYVELEFTSADTLTIYGWGFSDDPGADGLATPVIPTPGASLVLGLAGLTTLRRNRR